MDFKPIFHIFLAETRKFSKINLENWISARKIHTFCLFFRDFQLKNSISPFFPIFLTEKLYFYRILKLKIKIFFPSFQSKNGKFRWLLTHFQLLFAIFSLKIQKFCYFFEFSSGISHNLQLKMKNFSFFLVFRQISVVFLGFWTEKFNFLQFFWIFS